MPPLDAAAAEKDDWISAPSAASAAPSAGKDDWITASAQHWAAPAGGEFGDLSAQASAPATPQSQLGADVNAAGQGAVSGTGSLIAGIGRQPVAAAAQGVQRQLAVMDAIDAGKDVPQGHDTIGYQFFSPAQRAEARADFTAANDEISKREPNAAVRAGMAMQAAAPTLFPVDPTNEGRQTSVMRMVGGSVPALAAGAVGTAVGGPVGGVLASAAVAGSQAYDDTYNGEIAKGKTPAEADAAGDKSALTNMVAMSVPLSKVLPLIPVPLREGFLKTIANVGANFVQRGGEMAAGNTLGSIASKYVASQTYDPGRAVFDTSGDDALDGFLTGLIVHGATSAVGAVVRPGPTRAAASISDVLGAHDVDGAIAAARQASQAPSGAAGPVAASSSAMPSLGQIFAATPADSAGASPVMTTASGMKVPYRFDVAEAADLIPASGDLQPRDRAGRVASSGQIFKMANTLDPELLHASPGPDQGAPTVKADGVVLAGNGRAAAIRQAYAMGNGDPYRAMVERYGFDTSGMSEPMLIRRLDQMSPEQARQIAVDSNIPAGQRMSGTEQAAIDAQSLTPDLLAQYNPLLTGGPTAAGNRSFVRAWVATLPESERNAAMGADGAISADGVRRLQGAMLSVAYGDKGTLSRSLESTDDTTKALTGALTDAAPAWAQLQAEITAGRVPPEMNVAAQLTRAVDMVRQAREKGQTIGDALGQGDVFNPLDPVTAGFLRAFANPALTGAASRSLVADILRRYAIEAGKASTAAGLFGDAEPQVAPADIVATVIAAAHAKTPIAAASAQVSPATAAGRVQAAPPALAPAVAAVENAAPAPPVPQSVGAAASRDTTQLTTFGRTAREIRGQQADMELADLMRTPQPGDARDIIPGASQTRAEIEQSPAVSREAKGLRQEFRGGFNEDEKANNEIYHKWIEDVTPSFEQLGTMGDQREAQWKSDERSVFGADPNGQPVSTEPLVQHFEGIFADPIHKSNSYLKKAFQPFVDALTDGNGDPIVMGAKELYGIRQEMARKVKAMATDPDLAQVRGEFGALLKLTDSVIMSGASSYRAMMDNYRNASKLITAGQRLAEGALKITNGSDRVITFGRFDAFMKNLWLERHGPNAYAPAKDIPQATWDHLMMLHERLARSASDQELARTRGSDTTQMMMEMARKGMTAAAHVVVGGLTHGVGNIFIPAIADHMANKRSLRLVEQHRHPDLSKYPTPGP
jgi:hypothetical protein